MKKTTTSKNELLELYHKMLLIRRFEEKAGQLYGMGHIGGFCHLYIGQEAVVVGIESIKKPVTKILPLTETMVTCLLVVWIPKWLWQN